jgi:hypothetical protein
VRVAAFRPSGRFRVNANHELLDDEVIDVLVRFRARIPVRPMGLIARGCGLPRADVDRMITEGGIVSAVRLSGRLSGDFPVTLKR